MACGIRIRHAPVTVICDVYNVIVLRKAQDVVLTRPAQLFNNNFSYSIRIQTYIK